MWVGTQIFSGSIDYFKYIFQNYFSPFSFYVINLRMHGSLTCYLSLHNDDDKDNDNDNNNDNDDKCLIPVLDIVY